MPNQERTPVVSENTTKKLPVRKHPAHPIPVEKHNVAIILFVTLAIHPRGNFLCNPTFHEAFLNACYDADAWSVGRYVIMPDHVHLFCAPAQCPTVDIKRWSVYLKERITKRLNKMQEHAFAQGLEGEAEPSRKTTKTVPWCWQTDVWDVQMRNGEHYHEKWEYVRLNPIRAGLMQDYDMWPWQGEVKVLQW
jgi:REP element-mobilizing transposase RayT